MKTLLKYMLLAGVVILTASCEREPLTDEGGEGAVHLAIDLSAETRAVNQSDFTPDPLKVRIYRPEGTDSALIRRYTKMEEILDPLYLVKGDYSVKVEAGNKENVAFVEEDATARRLKLCYEGWRRFEVKAHESSTIEVACPTINVRANLLFDTSDSEMDTSHDQTRPKYENRLISDVKITVAALTTTAQNVSELMTAIADAEAPVLTFEQFETTADTDGVCAASGYFLMPEGVKTLIWAFEGTHETDGQIARVGTISNVKQAHAYKVRFNYSRTPDGYARVEVLVDENVETMDDKWYFKPQPEISGAGIDAAGVNTYTEGSDVVLVCESINDLKMLSLGGVKFFDNGEPLQGTIAGVTCEKNESTKVTITVSEPYFDTMHGGVQALEFGMQDAGGSDIYAQKIQFFKQGLVVDETATDLWANTAVFKAIVMEEASSVVIRFRQKGTSEWVDCPASIGADGYTYTAHTTAVWEADTNSNPNGHTVYRPNVAKSIFANNVYEYQLLVDGVEHILAEIATPATPQTIAQSSFEDSSMSCWTTNNTNTTMWGSGNNSTSETLGVKPLCQQGSYAGQAGNYCAYLHGRTALGILAAGNLFTGTFKLSGGDGTVSFGVPYQWQARPTALKLRYWGKIGTVDSTDSDKGIKIPKDDPDQASIYVCIVDWSKRHEVLSGTGSVAGVWSPEDGMNPKDSEGDDVGKIIGYGVVYPMGETSGSSMVEYEIPIVYYDTESKPSQTYSLIIACATSRYGDFMNGDKDNEIYVDDFQWSYAGEFLNKFAESTY